MVSWAVQAGFEFVYFMCMSILPACTCLVSVDVKKRVLDPLELELATAVSHQVRAEDQSQDLCKDNK